MKFVFISTLFDPPWGGSEKLWSETALRALEAGHEVSVFVSQRSLLEPPLQRLADSGARLLFWRPDWGPLNLAQRTIKKALGRNLPEWEWWHRHLPQGADAICLSQGGVVCGLQRHGLTEAIAAAKRPYVVLARADAGCEFLDAETRPWAKVFLEKAFAYVTASRSTVDLMRLYLPSVMANAQVLHSPIYDSVQSAPNYPGDDLVRFACVGRLRVSDKGQHLLLACLAQEPWRSRPIHLTFYGEGPDKAYLQELASFLGLQGKVKFAGQNSDIGAIWRDTHLAIQPSLVEGAPQSLLEAMLCRRPCVATSVSGIPEWVEDGKTGFLAQGTSVKDLAAVLERAWENRHRWREMGEAGRQACLAKRNPDPAGTLLGLLQGAAATSGA